MIENQTKKDANRPDRSRFGFCPNRNYKSADKCLILYIYIPLGISKSEHLWEKF